MTYHYLDSSGKLQRNVYPISISFGKSVAPLKLIGKKVERNIVLSPKVKGDWKWNNESNLVFEPKDAWPPGEKFHVSLGDDLTTGKYELEKEEFEFEIPAMNVSSAKEEFFEDPRNPKIRKAIFTLKFNYPLSGRRTGRKDLFKRV